MKEYLLNFFKYNDWAFQRVLGAIAQLPDKDESVQLLSHVIMASNRWYNRVSKEVDDSQMKWSGDTFPFDQLEPIWNELLQKWMKLLEKNNESFLNNYVEFVRPKDGKKMSVKIIDVILQINYHSIHHRAQILRIIRQQGQTPPTTDYIVTAMKEI